MRPTLLILLAAGIAAAQTGTVNGPTMGWVWDEAASSLRNISGIPGSSILGSKLAPPVRLENVAVSNEGGYAIGTGSEDHRLYVWRLNGGSAPQPLDVAAGVGRVALSPKGNSAALLYAGQNKAVILNGLTEGHIETREMNLPSETLGTFAVNDAGTLVLAAYRDGVRVFDENGNQWNLNHSGTVQSAVFLDGSSDALLAGDAGVWLVEQTAGNAQLRQLWNGNARQAAIASNRRDLVWIDGVKNVPVAMNLESGISQELECGCTPVTLARMAGGNVFRLNSLSDEPLWLVDLGGQSARTVFVPADVASGE